MPKIKDTDYLFLSTRIKSMERNLLNGERLERMLEAKNAGGRGQGPHRVRLARHAQSGSG